MRPFLPGDGDADARKPAVEPGADGVSLALAGEAEGAPRSPTRGGEHDKRRPRKRETYAYDRVFGPEVGQEEVFGEVSEFVQSALDGYQVCLLSYGQTGFVSASRRAAHRAPDAAMASRPGASPRRHRRDSPHAGSGKTHTMQGAGSGPMRGIIPRAMEQVAAYCAQQRTRGWAYEMEVTYVEIYNEQVRDLLGEDAGAPTTRDFGRAEAQSGLEVFLRRPFPFACSVLSSRDACAIMPSGVLPFACAVAFETPSRPRSRRRATSERCRHTQVRRDPKTAASSSTAPRGAHRPRRRGGRRRARGLRRAAPLRRVDGDERRVVAVARGLNQGAPSDRRGERRGGAVSLRSIQPARPRSRLHSPIVDLASRST